MAVGITVGSITDEIGSAAFVHAFFSTISAHCEPGGWGTRFPHLMRHLYRGRLPHQHARAALDELAQAGRVLEQLSPADLVWDIDDRKAAPPWGNDIAPTITSLGNYFVSSAGRDVFALLREALEASSQEQRDATLG